MISDGFQKDRFYNSLRLRMIVMMTLALLPIGMIAVIMTNGVTNAAQKSAQLSLKLMTEQAAFEERLQIERAMATVEVLANQANTLLSDPQTCALVLGKVVNRHQRFSNASIVPLSGLITCSSTGEPFDLSATPTFREIIESAAPAITINSDGPLSNTSVLIVSTPYFTDGAIAGFASVSIPHASFKMNRDDISDEGLINLITMRADGTILTASSGLQDARDFLPTATATQDYLHGSRHTFYAKNRSGKELLYSIVPVPNSAIFVMGIWSPDADINAQLVTGFPAGFFPALMWLISLAVSLFAVNRLVTRHISVLSRQMTHFAKNRRAVKAISTAEMPTELRDIQDSFLEMADSILKDEASLEDSVREKNVLLKEIHHRVKNNLQLISSIVNMQVRSTPDPNTKAILRRIQDRVLSLATIHRDLYQGSDNGRVNVGALVKEVVEKSVDIGVDSGTDIDFQIDITDVHLFPDQAVPLSLLTAEAATNALKYMGAHDGKPAYLTASLSHDDNGQCTFLIENSIGKATGAESSGLGAQLIKAFAIQLGATLDVEQTDEVYRMRVSFKAVEFAHEAINY